jgi:hypothetical protein
MHYANLNVGPAGSVEIVLLTNSMKLSRLLGSLEEGCCCFGGGGGGGGGGVGMVTDDWRANDEGRREWSDGD